MLRSMRTRTICLAIICAMAPLATPGYSAEVLTLEECVARALKFTPSVEIATSGVDFSAAQLRETSSSMFPTLRTELEYQNFPGYNIAITNRELSRGQLISEYLAYDGGRRLAQIRAARYRAEENAFGAAAALRQIVFDTRVAYFDLLRATQAEREFTASQERISGFARAVAALRLSGRAT